MLQESFDKTAVEHGMSASQADVEAIPLLGEIAEGAIKAMAEESILDGFVHGAVIELPTIIALVGSERRSVGPRWP